MPLLSLLTDFGLSDPFVGEMKGIAKRVSPNLEMIDVTHGIARGDVREAAWVLAKAWRMFPEGTCHVAVVDPGVGTGRKALAASAAGHLFVAPDNGLLMPALESIPGDRELREVTLREIDHRRRGTTFDGRDLFAPIGARLASGLRLAELGPEVHDPVGMAPFRPVPADDAWDVEIVRVDRFGNLVTVVEEAFLREKFEEDWRAVSVRVGDRRISGVQSGYEDVGPGEPLLTVGGSGTLEVAVRGGSARELLGWEGSGVRLDAPSDPRNPR
jgi:S-adenosylmethionine hydrolase